jgi:hypothetical protein
MLSDSTDDALCDACGKMRPVCCSGLSRVTHGHFVTKCGECCTHEVEERSASKIVRDSVDARDTGAAFARGRSNKPVGAAASESIGSDRERLLRHDPAASVLTTGSPASLSNARGEAELDRAEQVREAIARREEKRALRRAKRQRERRDGKR